MQLTLRKPFTVMQDTTVCMSMQPRSSESCGNNASAVYHQGSYLVQKVGLERFRCIGSTKAALLQPQQREMINEEC